MEIVMILLGIGLILTVGTVAGTYYTVVHTDFESLSRITYRNSRRLFRTTLNHPWMAKITDLESFHWSGIGFNTIMAIQGGIAAAAFLLSGLLRNPWLTVPLFLFGREIFTIAAMFLRRYRRSRENAELETLLRLLQALYSQSKSRRESLGQLAGQLKGVWREEIGKLYRRLGSGGDTQAHFDAFAAAFPSNSHVRLLAQLLYHAEVYGGDMSDTLQQILGDVMQDRLDEERNRSETTASMMVSLLLNAGVTVIAVFNLSNSNLAEIMIHSPDGRLLLAIAALCCAGSLRLTRNITTQ